MIKRQKAKIVDLLKQFNGLEGEIRPIAAWFLLTSDVKLKVCSSCGVFLLIVIGIVPLLLIGFKWTIQYIMAVNGFLIILLVLLP